MNKLHIELLLRHSKGLIAVLEDLYRIEVEKENEKRLQNMTEMQVREIKIVKVL